MAIGVHSRAMHQHKDPTSSPTKKAPHGGHLETAAVADSRGGARQNVGMARQKTLRERSKSTLGEGV